MAIGLLLALTTLTAMAAGDVCSGPCHCSSAGHLHVVDCSRRGLTGLFSSPADWPAALRVDNGSAMLDLRRNRISEVARLPALPALLSLSLAHNHVRSLQEGAFAALSSLELLDLSNNQLTGDQIRLDIFRYSQNDMNFTSSRLLSLDLGYNNISHLQARALENVPNLQQLRLNNNPLLYLETSIQEGLHALNSLQVLDFSYTGISTVDHTFFKIPSIKGSLREIYLAGNDLKEVPESFSIIGSTLQILNLNGNPILELNDTSFFGLHNIRRLYISEMDSLFRIAPGTFDSQQRLQFLFCSSNPRLTDIDKDAFRELKNKWPIKEVYLNNNSLESMSANLLPWDAVDVLDIRDNPWNCDCRLSWLPRHFGPLMTTTMQMVGRLAYCDKPTRWSGVSLVDMPADQEAWCSDQDWTSSGSASGHSTTASLIMLAAAIVLLTVLAIILLCIRHRRPPLAYAIVQPPQPYVLVRH